MLNDFVWKNVRGTLILYYKEKTFYCAKVTTGLREGNYVDVYVTPDCRLEFYEENLEIAKLKAEIKAKEFYEKTKGGMFDV